MKTSERVAARAQGQPVPTKGRDKTAAFSQEDKGPQARNIPKGHSYDKRALKPLSKALWATSVALGHCLTAYRHLSRLKSTTISPDGLLGGRGYTMGLQDMRKRLHEAAESLSSISDTLYDEATAPHWKPQLAQLDPDDAGDVNRFIEESQENIEDPESDAEDEIEEIEDEDNSALAEKSEEKGQTKKASYAPHFAFLWGSEPIVSEIDIYANSSVSPAELGGPRVDHIGPGEGNGPFGEYNEDTVIDDQWTADGGGPGRRGPYGEDYDYPSPWENTASWKESASSYPDGDPDQAALLYVDLPWSKESASGQPIDMTPTEGRDFGLGFGARGQGTQHTNPSGEGNGTKGIHGPHSSLPGAPSTSSGDTPEALDQALNQRQAYDALYGATTLPQDAALPVQRSDYYHGPKDNMVSVGTSEVPGEERVPGVGGQPLVDTYHTQEDINTEYVRWDSTTKTIREPEGDHPGQDHQEPWALDGEATR